MFNTSAIDIAVTTYCPHWYSGKVKKSPFSSDKIRVDLALTFIARTTALGMHIVVVDEKSSLAFRATLRLLKGIQVFLRKGHKRSPARRIAIEKIAANEEIEAKETFREKRRSQRLGIITQIRHLLFLLAHDKKSKLVKRV